MVGLAFQKHESGPVLRADWRKGEKEVGRPLRRLIQLPVWIVVAQNSGAADFVPSFKKQATGFADGLKLKRKRRVKKNSMVFGLSNWKNSIVIYGDAED